MRIRRALHGRDLDACVFSYRSSESFVRGEQGSRIEVLDEGDRLRDGQGSNL